MQWLGLASCALLALMLGIALFNLATAPRLERAGKPQRLPLVSLLVPARDEAEVLPRTLPRLLAQRYPRLEILVLDDSSADGTARVVEHLASGDPRLRLLSGGSLPEGWLGKNRACDRLAREAAGEVLLFCDADVFAQPEAVARTVALLETADAVTAIPRQRLRGWVEHAVVPLVTQLPVAATLPLRLVPATRSPALSMANGQWLAFRRPFYERIGGHAAVRAEVVEDVALGRLVKRRGGRLLAVLAPGLLEVEMYSDAARVREGFSKNLYPLLGGRPALLAAGVALFALVGVYPWAGVLLGAPHAALALALLAALRAAAARCCGLGWRSVALHPVGAVLATGIALESFAAHRAGRPRWKGRRLTVGITKHEPGVTNDR